MDFSIYDLNKNFLPSDVKKLSGDEVDSGENFWNLREMYGDDSEPQEVVPEKVEPENLKTSSFTKIFIMAPLKGGFTYYFFKAVRRLRIIDQSIQLTPQPFVLGTAISAAIIETALGIHALVLRCLGDRATYENLKDPAHATTACHLRQKSWKVISFCEAVPRKIDAIYSRIFAVRTEQDIRSQFPDNQKYYRDGDPDMMEIVRRAFCQMLEDLFKETLPFYLGVQGAALLGYPNPLSMMVLKGIHFNIIFNLFNNISNVYQEIKKSEDERADIVRNFNYLDGLSQLESRRGSNTGSDQNEEVELEGLEKYPGLFLATT